MPKDVVDYSNTIIYKIYCKNEMVTDIYVGHTTNFTKRKYHILWSYYSHWEWRAYRKWNNTY